jgi:hypothetical protein
MAIEFTYRGKKWRADTPEEAIALREKLESEDHVVGWVNPAKEEELLYEQTKWTPDRFYELVQSIGPMQQRFLAVLLVATKHSISAEEARKKTGVASLMALAGVQSKLARQVRLLGLEPSDLYQVQIDWKDGERKRYFTVDKGFRLVAYDDGWPPEHIRKEVGKEKNAASTKEKRR